MPDRAIRSRARGSSVQLADCLASVLTLELLAPGPELYLISPWISDVPLLSNRFGQLRALLPDMARGEIGLSRVLTALSERGVHVRILCRPDHPQTEDFLR